MSGRPYTKAQQLGPARSKPYRRIVASPKQWAALQAERQGRCIVCAWLGRNQIDPSSLHHVVPRDRGGDDVAENLVPLCGTGTTGCHGHVEARNINTLQALAAAIQDSEPAVYAYAVEKLGEDGWLRLHRVNFNTGGQTA